MAATIPAALKSIDITRFAMRAAQLEKAKPVMAYWCESFQSRWPSAVAKVAKVIIGLSIKFSPRDFTQPMMRVLHTQWGLWTGWSRSGHCLAAGFIANIS